MSDWRQYIIDPNNVTQKALDPRLLACPFCGAAGLLGYRPAMQEFFAMCSDKACGAFLAKHDNKGFTTDHHAVARWNLRDGWLAGRQSPTPGATTNVTTSVSKAETDFSENA